MADRFEVLREAMTGQWFVVEENAHGWHIGCSGVTKRQAQRRRQILLKDFHMSEIKVAPVGDSFVAVQDGVCLGLAYATEIECRRAHNLMDFSLMGRYAPKERNRTRFERDDVV